MESLLLFSKITLSSLYIFILVVLCILGLNRYYLFYIQNKFKNKKNRPLKYYSRLPRVTVQLPIYNEMYVAKRLIDAVCKLDYPSDLLEIQVLDDSTDNTSVIAENAVKSHSSEGVNIQYLHRDNRAGFKAGALENGLKYSRGELIVIFDADFIPPADFLTKTVDYFTDENVGIVQTRWGHINKNYCSLTKAQSILLDGHFVVEQFARSNGGYYINFNGTAGILRKSCIKDAGGWQHDTLTEDLDLSYRAQMKGWRAVYLNDVVVDAELPVEINSFKSQQHRWAKGGIQTAAKLLPSLLSNKNIQTRVKIQSLFHLLGNISYPLLLMLIILMIPLAYLWSSVGWEKVIMFNLLAITAGTLSVFNFYFTAVRSVYGSNWLGFARYIPLSIALGSGLAINNTKAVFEALFKRDTDFNRTPKFAVTKNSDTYFKKNYTTSRNFTSLIELLLGIALMIKTVYAAYLGFYGWIPFLLIIQFGFFYTSLLSYFHNNINIFDTVKPTILKKLTLLRSK
ncbi:MAG TPA: cellulose synthase family protein [Thermodesulfobacteriota bacterium]|nr:cellulose synthase family protein [Thermodesulfobacteriota bacterium]